MPIDEGMTVNEQRKYLKLMRPRYVQANRVGRGGLLTEMAAVTGLHRKSLLRLLHAPRLERAPKRPRLRRRQYGADVGDVVRVVWESLDYVCAERLTPALRATAQQLAQWEVLVRTPEVEAQLAGISRATVQRLLQRFQLDTPKLPRHKPQAPNRLLREVPMERLSWATSVPGSFETDLVHHCGPVAEGPGGLHLRPAAGGCGHGLERTGGGAGAQPGRRDGGRVPAGTGPAPVSHLRPTCTRITAASSSTTT